MIRRLLQIILLYLICTTPLAGQFSYTNDAGTLYTLTYEPNDLLVAATTSRFQKDIQLGYSPIKHLSIRAGYASFRLNQTIDSEPPLSIQTKGGVMNFSVGTYAFLRLSDWENNKHQQKHPSGTLFFFNTGYGKGKIMNRQDQFRGDFDYQKLFFNTGFSIKRNYGSLSITGQYSIIEFLAIDLVNFHDQAFLKRFATNTINQFEQSSFCHTFEINLHAELGIRQSSIIMGISNLVAFKNGIRFNKGSYIGILLEIDEIAQRIKKKE